MFFQELDNLVNDPRFLPYHGWHDDHRDKDKTSDYLPAIQQVKSEFITLLHILEKCNLKRKCLQLGLGVPGGAHYVFENYFQKVWTVEIIRETAVQYYNRMGSTNSNIFVGDSHDLLCKQFMTTEKPFDLLFIDAGHTYQDVIRDWYFYEPLVRKGGIVAFHDSLQRKGYPEVEVWRVISWLQAVDFKIKTIGTEVGISYWIKS